jgi:hypothetical protein
MFNSHTFISHCLKNDVVTFTNQLVTKNEVIIRYAFLVMDDYLFGICHNNK